MVLAVCYFDTRDYDRAIEQFRKSAELASNHIRAYEWLVFSYSLQGRHEEAIVAAKKIGAVAGSPSRSKAVLGYAYAQAGNLEEARNILEELRNPQETNLYTIYYTAILCVALDELDPAFALLNKACDERLGPMCQCKVLPLFDNVRSDPRFQALLRRMGLE